MLTGRISTLRLPTSAFVVSSSAIRRARRQAVEPDVE
jgi:hypothetical protein